MAYHFSANQYEDKYNPKKLGNWEYPKWYPDRPRQRTAATKVIADDNGHLLEGIPRENPWGNYIGTWDLPKRITREFAEKLAAPPDKLVTRWGKQNPGPPQRTPRQTEQSQEALTCRHCCEKLSECICQPFSKMNKMASSSSSEEDVEKCVNTPLCAMCGNTLCLCLEHYCPSTRTE